MLPLQFRVIFHHHLAGLYMRCLAEMECRGQSHFFLCTGISRLGYISQEEKDALQGKKESRSTKCKVIFPLLFLVLPTLCSNQRKWLVPVTPLLDASYKVFFASLFHLGVYRHCVGVCMQSQHTSSGSYAEVWGIKTMN